MVKIELSKVEDGNLDLSMSELEEVPLKEIVAVKRKVKKLDLSNNQLTSLQSTFASQLTQLVELDLSKNQLIEVPDNFGLMVNLTHLDLYMNKIERLPLSFKELTKLRWLDLKDNPLTPQLSKIAGPCVDQSDCQKCARDVVLVMQEISKSIEAEKQRTTEERQQGAPKEKKKKKKNKSSTVASDAASRSHLNGSNQNTSASKLTDQSGASEDEKDKLLGSTTANGTTRSNAGCCAALPLRLCCAITRAFLWSLVLVAVFIGILYVTSLPETKPYTATITQQYEITREKILVYAGDFPDKLSFAFDWLRDSVSQFSAWSQDFVVNKVPVHAANCKVIIIETYEKVKNQVYHLIDSKKD